MALPSPYQIANRITSVKMWKDRGMRISALAAVLDPALNLSVVVHRSFTSRSPAQVKPVVSTPSLNGMLRRPKQPVVHDPSH